MMGLRDVGRYREACKGRVLVKRCGASGPTVETHHDFGLGATGPRLLALPGPFKALARRWKRIMILGSVLQVRGY